MNNLIYAMAAGWNVPITSLHHIINFPRASDMPLQLEWAVRLTAYPAPARERETLSGKRRYDGEWQFTWTADVLTPLMYTYLKDTFFSTGQWWGYVTVVTPAIGGGHLTLNATLNIPPGLNFSSDEYLLNVPLRFSGRVTSTETPVEPPPAEAAAIIDEDGESLIDEDGEMLVDDDGETITEEAF